MARAKYKLIRANKDIILQNRRNGLSWKAACKAVSVTDRAHQLERKKDPDYDKECNAADTWLVSMAVSELAKRVMDGRASDQTLIKIAETKDKEEWAEADKAGEEPYEVVINTYGPDDPLLKALEKDKRKKEGQAD